MTEIQFWTLIAFVAILDFIIVGLAKIGDVITKKSRLWGRAYKTVIIIGVIFLLRFIVVVLPNS